MEEGNLVSKASGDGGEGRLHFQLQLVASERGNVIAVLSLSAVSNTKVKRTSARVY